MERKDLMQKIKDLLNFSTEIEDVNTFADVKDIDGNVIRIPGDVPAVGDALVLITENGEELAPDSEFTLEDGTIIKTDAESKISEVIEAEIPTGEEEATDETAAPEGEMTVEPTIQLSEERFEALNNRINELEGSLKKLTDATLSMVDVVENYGKLPVDDIKTKVTSSFTKTKDEIQDVRERNLQSLRDMRLKK